MRERIQAIGIYATIANLRREITGQMARVPLKFLLNMVNTRTCVCLLSSNLFCSGANLHVSTRTYFPRCLCLHAPKKQQLTGQHTFTTANQGNRKYSSTD